MQVAYPDSVPLFVPYAPSYDNPMSKLCYVAETCTIGFGFADGSGIFNDLDYESMGGECIDVQVDGIVQIKFVVHRESQERNGVHPIRRLIEIKAMDGYDETLWKSPVCRAIRDTDMSHVSQQTDSIAANARFVGINYQQIDAEIANGMYYTYNTKFAFEMIHSEEVEEFNEDMEIIDLGF